MCIFAEGADGIEHVISSSVSQEALGVRVEDMPPSNTSPVMQEHPERTGEAAKKFCSTVHTLKGACHSLAAYLATRRLETHKIEHQRQLSFSLIAIHNAV